MNLREIVVDSNLQYVLSFSNNNSIFVHPEDFDVNSKFMRRSKVRMGVDFEFVGYIRQDGTMDSSCDLDSSMVYRTYRGNNLNDYVLYVNENPEIIISHIKEYKHSRVCEYRQQTLNAITKPDKDRVLHIYPGLDSITFKGNVLMCDYTTHIKVSSSRYYGMWESIIISLRTADRYKEKFSEVNIHLEKNSYNNQIIDYIYNNRHTNNYKNLMYLSVLKQYNKLNVRFCI